MILKKPTAANIQKNTRKLKKIRYLDQETCALSDKRG